MYLLPTQSQFRPQSPITIDVMERASSRTSAEGTARLFKLGELIEEAPFSEGHIVFSAVADGGYGVEAQIEGQTFRTAVEVSSSPRSRLRYGFVASYRPDKDVSGVTELAKRLHLNGIQFYDWAYRHADLLGGGPRYDDPLGQPIELSTVRELVDDLTSVGTASYGYAAVYAVGNDEWDLWKHDAIVKGDGTAYSLGDFLQLVDPSAPDWLEHFRNDLKKSAQEMGFQGFHLDQYGYPKYATLPTGEVVDIPQAFMKLIDGVAEELPESRLIFNNVNDFPTWLTGAAPQSALYIEPWEPNSTLQSLADIVKGARAANSELPIVMAAYQSAFKKQDVDGANRATALTMATLFSHGATQLLAGEDANILVDPYYVENQKAEESTLDLLYRWYDFLVEHDALLMDPSIADVTRSFVGTYNADMDVSFSNAPVCNTAEPGSVWRRITQTPEGLVVHLINLVGQEDPNWDEPRNEFGSPGTGTLRFRTQFGRKPRVRVADPDGSGMLLEVLVQSDGEYATADLPNFNAWQVIHVLP